MKIGIIGGSGLYQLEEAAPSESIEVETPYGSPSGSFFVKKLGANTLYFLPRHGVGHRLLPSEINYRANIFALKKLGVEKIISVSAVGSLKKDIVPGHIVFPDQYIDLTRDRVTTFFGRGVVGHAHFSDPTCPSLRRHIHKTAMAIGATCHDGGTYVCMEGPQFSTRAESHWYRSWGLEKGRVDVIGMTALPEAKLAREAGICYQTVAMATDYDCWNEETEAVSVEAVVAVLHKNVGLSRNLVLKLGLENFPSCDSNCRQTMKHAIMTPRELWPESRRDEIEVLLS